MIISRLIPASALAVMLLAALPASADTRKDTVVDQRQKVITNTWGNCVRTKWDSASDPCEPDAPAPTPVVQAPPPPPQISQDERTIYFDFNKAVLTEQGKQKLDNLSNTIRNSKAIVSASVVGYTDQIGKNDYNMKLSQRRAKAVKDYLDQHVSIPTSVANVRGLGKSNPLEQCAGIKKRAERISCMAPERRVEVEFKYQE